jgi:regulator of sigma E protease
VSKKEFSFMESIPVGVTRGTDQLVGYGKQLKMILVQVRAHTNKWGVLKPYFDIFSKFMGLGAFLDYHGIIIDNG